MSGGEASSQIQCDDCPASLCTGPLSGSETHAPHGRDVALSRYFSHPEPWIGRSVAVDLTLINAPSGQLMRKPPHCPQVSMTGIDESPINHSPEADSIPSPLNGRGRHGKQCQRQGDDGRRPHVCSLKTDMPARIMHGSRAIVTNAGVQITSTRASRVM